MRIASGLRGFQGCSMGFQGVKKELEGVSKELHVTAGVQGVPEGHQGVSWGFHRVSVHLDEFLTNRSLTYLLTCSQSQILRCCRI